MFFKILGEWGGGLTTFPKILTDILTLNLFFNEIYNIHITEYRIY